MKAEQLTNSGAGLSPLLRPKEAAAVLAISPRKLWELTNCGTIPCVRMGKAVRYDPADLNHFIRKAKNGKGCK